MGNFNRDNRSRGGSRRFDANRGGDRQMFRVTCSNCSKECEVPFKPTGGKPVYCSDCFRTMKGSDSARSNDRGFRRPSFDNRDRSSTQPQYREQFEALNAKLDKILQLLNPEKSTQTPKVITEPQVKDTSIVENIEPIKKKTKVKKLIPIEETVETPVINETPTETEIPEETSKE